MSGLKVPWDELAERTLVGCVVATPAGAELAAERVDPDDFHHPGHRRLFVAALELGDVIPQGARIGAVSVVADVRLGDVVRLVDERRVEWDLNGVFAGRVVELARRRELMAAARDVLHGLGAGSTVADLSPALTTLAGAA